MDSKKFKMIDESFKCIICGKKVNPLKYSARDHCPYCLYSIHIDINPGDRLNKCHGILKPIDIDKFKDTYKIVYKCEKCHEIHRNIIANDDNFDMILKIMSNKN